MRTILALAFILVMATAAHAGTWYLMAADLNDMSNPSVGERMSSGPRLGPLHLTSQAQFPSREECEPARDKLVEAWRRQSVVKRGGWDRYGITTPAVFIRCVADSDPHLKRRGDSAPMLEIYLNKRRFR